MEAEAAHKSYIEYEIPYARGGGRRNSPAACSAPARRSASATCAAWGSSTARPCRRWSSATPGAGLRSVTRTASRAPTTTTSATTATPSSCASRPAASTAAAVPRSARGRRRRVLRLHADRLRHAGHDAARHEPQRHAVRVLRALRRDVPDGRADAQAAHPPEVRGRREPLHPVRDLRRRLPVRRAARRRGLRARPHQPATR